ncbi:putative cytochrome P450 oxidoreductase [Chaetomidium leptoderma]|uniref:Cytochrome P450 oxidoreductase n=1 Tax=Chaetomidium leptoderma TaxID=669021 RepID=A0AAN6ZUC6_9PEZI|nr:putative cytochrome P450 oxidoreductase [Chaetomidium leptoderma]
MASTWVPYFVALAIVAVSYRLLQVGKRDPRMPKGPPTIPILGNAHQIPSTGLYKQFREWAKEYGSVFTLKLGPANVVVLCDRKAIHKLLVEKGSIYSDRPMSYAAQILTKGDHVAFEQMTPAWREKRKVIAHNFSPARLDKDHFKIQEAEATVLMNDLLETPDNFFDHIRRYTASVATCITHGFRAPTFDSFWGHGVYDVMDRSSVVMEPGANPPVDEFPFLRYIPKQFAFWKRRAGEAGDTMDAVWAKARRLVDERRAKGDRRECILDNILDQYQKKESPFDAHALNNLLGEMIEGGADTTSSQLLTLILAFALYPHVQEKARKEIDAVCGTERSPAWADFAQLPYINCIVKEGMRWRPVAPTAIPHRVRQDDEYEGMFIPKDTTVFIPTWAIHHMDSIYPDHDTFNPDRYENHPKLANDYAGSSDWATRDHYNYGAGRRICPGMHLAERNMWRIAAKLLWAFEFSEPVDPKTGKVMPLDPDAYSPGILQAPLKYSVVIKPRSAAHTAQIREEKGAALQFLKQFE